MQKHLTNAESNHCFSRYDPERHCLTHVLLGESPVSETNRALGLPLLPRVPPSDCVLPCDLVTQHWLVSFQGGSALLPSLGALIDPVLGLSRTWSMLTQELEGQDEGESSGRRVWGAVSKPPAQS